MGYYVEIAEAAEEDVRRAFLWYERKVEDLGYGFESSIDDAIESIEYNPFKTQIRYGDTRIFYLKKFPYGIHFQVKNDLILIAAIFHTSRDPKKWTERNE